MRVICIQLWLCSHVGQIQSHHDNGNKQVRAVIACQVTGAEPNATPARACAVTLYGRCRPTCRC